MSKENRRKSKVNKVLKAAGTAGVVFGAASIDANVVFAAELEEGMETQQTEAAAVAQAELQDTAASQAVAGSRAGAGREPGSGSRAGTGRESGAGSRAGAGRESGAGRSCGKRIQPG